jgi:hypothetical protein
VSGLEEPLRELRDQRAVLERSWDATDGSWRDDRRRRFGRLYVQPALRITADVTGNLEATADIVGGAIRSLR